MKLFEALTDIKIEPNVAEKDENVIFTTCV